MPIEHLVQLQLRLGANVLGSTQEHNDMQIQHFERLQLRPVAIDLGLHL